MIRRISRRAFVSMLAVLVASAAMGFELQSADAQQPAALRRIGVLIAVPPDDKDPQGLRQGLRDAGYIEGRDVAIEWRSANGDYARIPELAADLVRRKVDVIVVENTRAAEAVKRLTSTIPIVLSVVADPVGSGLVASDARPGGNVTGLSFISAELSAKRLQLLKEAVPRLTRVAVLWNPDTPWHQKAIADLKAAALGLSLKLSFVSARRPDEFSPAFSEISREISRTHVQGLYVMDDVIFSAHRTTLLNLVSKAQLPSSYSERPFVVEGGLMSYGANISDMWRRSARYVDKILRGAKPGDLPIERPTKFELMINLKTAKTLGLKIPDSMLDQASEVIR